MDAWERLMPWFMGAAALLLLAAHFFAEGDSAHIIVAVCAIILWVGTLRT